MTFTASGELRKIVKNILAEYIRPLEGRLGIETGFFDGLLNERDDWSFIIKLHALVETAVSHYLAQSIGNLKLEGAFQNVPLSTEHGGKVDFLKTLGLLKEHRSFIKQLSKMRNHYVHSVSNVNLKFEDYFANDKEAFRFFAKQFKRIAPETSKSNPSIILKRSPATAIWVLTMLLLIKIYQGVRPRGVIGTPVSK